MGAAALIGTAVSLVGTVISSSAQTEMIAGQTRASKRAESLREQQMMLEAHRRRRQSARAAILARSQNLSVGTQQGATGGSGLTSALSGAISQGKQNISGINSSETIGGGVFQSNRDYFNATQKGQGGMALGQGISSIGGALVSNAGAIGRLGA